MASDGYIVSRRYDWAFFLLPPLIALTLGICISASPTHSTFLLGTESVSGTGLFIGVLIHAHLVAVLLRSHGNASIRHRHPVAFFVVPVVLLIALVASPWFAVLSVAVATFWDVWHSGAQTFGFARIYERNAGNPCSVMRRWDFALNQLLYAGPIVAGATLMDHVSVFEEFGDFDDFLALAFARTPGAAEAHANVLSAVVLIAGTCFLIAYLVVAWQQARRGHPPPWQKVVLLVVTGACSIYTWGLNSWGEAFFIMNFFHAVQYLALVWAIEGGRASRLLRLHRWRHGRALTGVTLLLAALGYGVAVELVGAEGGLFWAVTMVVSLMHFWYDAFIWSVRRADV